MEIQRARPEDSPFLRRIAARAYAPYVRRIGREPAPMTVDFAPLVAAGDVWTLAEIADIIGFIVMRETRGSLHIESVAVDPEAHGQGYGRALLDHAETEALRRFLPRLDLYTNAVMTENLALYARLGWREVARRREDGFERVYFEKTPAETAGAR